MTVTLSFQSSGIVPGDGQPVRMRGGSLTLGRGQGNDLMLADPERTLSKTHCVIEDHNGNIVVVDLSTNGTFLNYSKIPLGRTPTPLNDGDVLSLGGYEIVVRMEQAASAHDLLPEPMAQDRVSHGQAGRAPDPMELLDAAPPEGDFLDDLLGSDLPAGPKGMHIPDPMDDYLPPLGEDDDPLLPGPAPQPVAQDSALLHGDGAQDTYRSPSRSGGGSVIPEDWDLDPFSENTTPPPTAARPAPPPPPPAPPPVQAPVAPAATAPAAVVAQPAPAAVAALPGIPVAHPGAAQAFIAALDLEDLAIPDAEMDSTMARMGRVMRIMITGLREILMTRTGIKSEFRIEQTMIGAGGNNPLKFSISPEQAIEALVRPRTRGYLEAETAVAEALRDIKAHEVAMVTGMEAALKGVLARLDPQTLTAQIEARGSRGGLFKGKKAVYWEVYEKMYAEISDQAQNDFHELFSREFARAYQDQLAKLK